MLLAREVLLHQHLDDHRHDHRARRDVRPTAPSHEHREPDHGSRRPGVHDPRVRARQPEEGEVRPEGDAHARVERPGERGDVGDEERPPAAEADLRDAEHEQDLRQRTPDGQVEGRYEKGERGAQQREPQRVLGAHGTHVLHEPVAPGPAVREVQEGRQTDGGEGHGRRPQPPSYDGRPYGVVQRPPFGTRPPPDPAHP
ncbi:hypothetical protein SGFS_084080 [Streptomyces graminofaciens]|uniref:Uncharacterized protein n=1 Tax=Streptomyces graminofaciens TaxID=68212 RepID=A0ABN5VUG9_9ACTN|nr:hypothetical protein SGFS_084080 [Streptomyces graminofaciens]